MIDFEIETGFLILITIKVFLFSSNYIDSSIVNIVNIEMKGSSFFTKVGKDSRGRPISIWINFSTSDRAAEV